MIHRLLPGVLAVIVVTPLAAQNGAGITVDPATKVAHATRVNGSAPHVDGRLDDAAWRQARFFSDFIMKDPVESTSGTGSST